MISEGEHNKDEIIESLTRDIYLFKNTLLNVNLFCESLKQSNQIMSQQLYDMERIIDEKTTTISLFLEKNGFSYEDLLEFETEVKLGLFEKDK